METLNKHFNSIQKYCLVSNYVEVILKKVNNLDVDIICSMLIGSNNC